MVPGFRKEYKYYYKCQQFCSLISYLSAPIRNHIFLWGFRHTGFPSFYSSVSTSTGKAHPEAEACSWVLWVPKAIFEWSKNLLPWHLVSSWMYLFMLLEDYFGSRTWSQHHVASYASLETIVPIPVMTLHLEGPPWGHFPYGHFPGSHREDRQGLSLPWI